MGLLARHTISRATRQLGQRQGQPLDRQTATGTSLRGVPRDSSFETRYVGEVDDWRRGGQSVLLEVDDEKVQSAWRDFVQEFVEFVTLHLESYYGESTFPIGMHPPPMP